MNYKLISQAAELYSDRYVYVPDAPWAVGREAYYATKPYDAGPDITLVVEGQPTQYMVASGEQSFIQMMLDGRFIKRAYCITPCFRPDRYDYLKRPQFEKLELINADDVTFANLYHMMHDAASFFERHVDIKFIQTGPMSFDIIERQTRIELGSYGLREMNLPDGRHLEWIYGTGCAEPRLSVAIHGSGRKKP